MGCTKFPQPNKDLLLKWVGGGAADLINAKLANRKSAKYIYIEVGQTWKSIKLFPFCVMG